jgi:hypothetical protein
MRMMPFDRLPASKTKTRAKLPVAHSGIMSPTMRTDREPNLSPRARRGEELNQKLGMLWSRFWAVVVGSAGVALLAWFYTGAENTTLGETLFVTAIGLLLLFVARHLWRNKDGLTEILDHVDTPVRRSSQSRD